MSNPTSNFGWQMPTATDLVTDLPADFEVFGQAVDTDLADLNGGTTGQLLSKTSNTDLDFTWVTPNAGDITGVTAGTGISGGGTSGDVTVTNSMATAIDAKGDLIAGTGADAFAKVTVGANGTTLVANSSTATGLEWQTPATFLARINTNQSISTSTITKVAFDTEIIDSAGGYDPTTNYRFTVPAGQGGYYLIGFDVAWGVYNAGHQVFMYIYKNGSAYEAPLIPFRDSGSDVVATGTFSKVVQLDATDYVEAYVQHNRGVAATLYSPNANFWGHKI